MARLITVDREDGRAVAGLLTSLLANWERIPISVQAAILKHAIEAAFESVGRTDGNYAVTAFVLKHRAAMTREERWPPGKRFRTAGPKGSLGTRAWEAAETIAARRRVTLKAAGRLIGIDLSNLMPKRRSTVSSHFWTTLWPRRAMRRRAA